VEGQRNGERKSEGKMTIERPLYMLGLAEEAIILVLVHSLKSLFTIHDKIYNLPDDVTRSGVDP
jgi:hypothetical protein